MQSVAHTHDTISEKKNQNEQKLIAQTSFFCYSVT